LPEALNSCLRPLKYKGLKKEMITKIGLYDIVKPTTPESNKSVEGMGWALQPGAASHVTVTGHT
jgi:hypothetical protein